MEMNKVIVGQKHMIERLLIGLWVKAIFYWKVSDLQDFTIHTLRKPFYFSPFSQPPDLLPQMLWEL
jgi:hypothetical protein